jgi:hypothetical protein
MKITTALSTFYPADTASGGAVLRLGGHPGGALNCSAAFTKESRCGRPRPRSLLAKPGATASPTVFTGDPVMTLMLPHEM